MKVLVDSSVWIDFARGKSEAREIANLLDENRVITHILIEAELRAGNMDLDRDQFFADLNNLEYAPVIEFSDLFNFIEKRKLFAKGAAFVDVMLLMSALLYGAQLWTHDKNLQRLGADLEFQMYDLS